MATTTATATSLSSSLSSLSLRTPRFSFFSKTTSFLSLINSKPYTLSLSAKGSSNKDDIDTTLFEEADPEEEEFIFEPPEKPEGFVPPRAIDEPPFESEEEIGRAYEELYGPAYSAESYLGNDVYAMDSKIKRTSGFGSKIKKEKIRDGFEETCVQVRRVTKVVKGGKNLQFRALVVVGDKKGQVGVGVGKAREVTGAVEKAATDARRNIVTVPMTKYLTFPHRSSFIFTGVATLKVEVMVHTGPFFGPRTWGNIKLTVLVPHLLSLGELFFLRTSQSLLWMTCLPSLGRAQADYGAATVMLRPAAPGTGVIAGGAVRMVLEMAGIENALGKQLGSNNAINNARATVRAVQSMRLLSEVASERGIPMEELWK
ncbi:hypothetical protein Cgig2_028886 [Carnegiea gigantea]|uniref:S5 DRBM domain-containing protein n=1 Tax=Carnegiea gigantea TaxID=171969 RepID=A0A9Q1KQN9_9CARY|nr:hypothetical protein Cgig2_028886 [Carnegiea gigantea]